MHRLHITYWCDRSHTYYMCTNYLTFVQMKSKKKGYLSKLPPQTIIAWLK